MNWGSDKEETAFEAFLEDFGRPSDLAWRYSDGLHVWADDGAVAASPDAVAYTPGQFLPLWCLEIKCPYAGKWQDEPFAEGMFLKKPQHWIQTQMNMACCGTPLGAFYVWTGSPDEEQPVRRRLIKLQADKDFVTFLRGKIDWWKEILAEDNPRKMLRVPVGWKDETLMRIEDSVRRSVTSDETFIG